MKNKDIRHVYHFKSTFFTPVSFCERHTLWLKIDCFDFLDQICPKILFPLRSRTNEHYHRIQHIRIGPGTEFCLNQTVLHFWTKFA